MQRRGKGKVPHHIDTRLWLPLLAAGRSGAIGLRKVLDNVESAKREARMVSLFTLSLSMGFFGDSYI